MNSKTNLDFKEIGSRIRLEREKLKLTREKFAEIVGLSSFYIGQIERGDRKMSLETLAKISASLHISVDYLLHGCDIYTQKSEIQKNFSVLETMDDKYNLSLNNNLQELLSILVRCSDREISLIKDITKLILPYLIK